MRLVAALLAGCVFGAGLGGAALFGVGWGLAGFCPGPALAALVEGVPAVYAFVLAMLAGMALHRLVYLPLRARAVPHPES